MATAAQLREKANTLLKQAKELEKAQFYKAGELAMKFLDKQLDMEEFVAELRKIRGDEK